MSFGQRSAQAAHRIRANSPHSGSSKPSSMVADNTVQMYGKKFSCVDQGFAPNEPVDVVIRPEDIDIVPVEQGQLAGTVTNVTFKGMCVPKGAKNKENAEKFINFMCSKDVGLANCEAIGYSTPLMSVFKALDPSVSGDTVAYPPDSVLKKCESFLNLPQDVLEFYDSEWLRLKV